MELSELRRERRELAAAVQLHQATLERFQAPGRCWFLLTLSEPVHDRDDGRPGHLSSTASTYESLADTQIASGLLPESQQASAEEFCRLSLAAPASQWQSEGAAHVYCRVRALPAVIRFSGELSKEAGEQIARLLTEAWSTVDFGRPDDGGLGEVRLYEGNERIEDPSEDGDREPYPANAFHTYWGVQALGAYLRRSEWDPLLPPIADEILERRKLAHAWSVRTAAQQTALITGGAERVDPQQLAYGLVTDLACDPESLTPGTQRYDLYASALSAFFSTQLSSGKWPLSEPLFHYPEAGNAYCYTFETLTELLRPALPREGGRAYRELLREHLESLIAAWRGARRTRTGLKSDTGAALAYGWSSGHHLFRREPEVWATASVFSFLQVLRCIVGHFAADAAMRALHVRPPSPSEPYTARRRLAERGDTWAADGFGTARRLASMFLHPRTLPSADPEIRDPDTKLIGEDDPRSAILFGPPGTGKTTLVQALAGALGWRFVEVQAAAFLSRGMDQVPAQAEAIFDALMELDRCVVLFDEVDELIRSRGEQETDPFGRFLTTSMLPKIAQLWSQRRVLFFVATNHVDKADPAIRRSSRFDAAILVAPPSLAAKERRLAELLDGEVLDLDGEAIKKALAAPDGEVPEEKIDPAGVLALLRWDQMSQLADYLRGEPLEKQPEALVAGLREMAEQLVRNEWRPENADGIADRPLATLYESYRDYLLQESQDRSKGRYVAFERSIPLELPEVEVVGPATDETWVGRLQGDLDGVALGADGAIIMTVNSGAQLWDDGLLVFSPAS